MEEVDKQEKLKQKEREKQLEKEFENMQRQLSEELQEQLEHGYQWKIKEIHLRCRQVTETYRVPGPSQRTFREDDYEAAAQAEQIMYWRCGKIGHRKKECWKTLFCTNCGRQGHS